MERKVEEKANQNRKDRTKLKKQLVSGIAFLVAFTVFLLFANELTAILSFVCAVVASYYHFLKR